MTLKSNVKFKDGSIAIIAAILVVESVYRERGIECVITSFNDSKHMKNSLHYVDRAFDVRTRTVPKEILPELVAEIKARLTDDFDVVLEKDHLHLEFQPK